MSNLYDAAAARVARGIVRLAANRVNVVFSFPDGSRWGPSTPTTPEFRVIDPDSFYRRLGRNAKMAFGEAYVAGDWTSGPDTDLADLLTPFAEKLTTLLPGPVRKLRRVIDRRLPHHTHNTREGAKSNVSAHYDMSNELFKAFLDDTLTYSCAWFDDLRNEPLETAQLRKIDGILDYAEVTTGTNLLEIGSGWGSLAIRAAQRGATVTSITLSQEQAELATERIKDLGLDDLARVEIADYRDIEGKFDAIVSVEMIEAVGEQYWPSYFEAIDNHLADGGRVAIQAILMGHDQMLATRNSYGWIQKYIFPGGLIPSLEAIEKVCHEHTWLGITDRRDMKVHYAETLRRWRARFNDNWAQIGPMGFDEEFRRIWEFYLAYCEAGFASGYLGVNQLRLARADWR